MARRRSWGPMGLVMLTASAAIGLLAGYGALQLIQKGRSDVAIAEHGPSPPPPPPIANRPGPSVDVATIEPQRTQRPQAVSPPQRTARRRPPSTPVVTSTEPVELPPEPESRQPIDPPAENDVGPRPVQPAPADPTRPSAIVLMSLTEPLIRVVGTPINTPTIDVRCDISLSEHLVGAAPQTGLPFTAAVTGMKRGQSQDILFTHSIKDVRIGVEVKFVGTPTTVTVELRPKYQLPSGYEGQFTQASGTRRANELNRNLSRAESATDALPSLQSQLGELRSNYQTALSIAGSGGGINAAQNQRALVARNEAQRLFRVGAALEKQIATAEQLKAAKPAIQAELIALGKIEKYALSIVDVGQIAVRLYSADQALAADVH